MTPSYQTFKSLSEIPNQAGPITVFYRDLDGSNQLSDVSPEILTDTFVNGKLSGDEEYYGILDVFPEFKSTTPIYVQDSAISAFENIAHFSELYRECNGNLDEVNKKMDEELAEEIAQREIELELEEEFGS